MNGKWKGRYIPKEVDSTSILFSMRRSISSLFGRLLENQNKEVKLKFFL